MFIYKQLNLYMYYITTDSDIYLRMEFETTKLLAFFKCTNQR